MVRVAAYQATPKGSFPERKQQIHDILAKVDPDLIDFLCFPEGFLTGYYSDETLARENSLAIQGSTFQEWLAEISSYRATILIGFNEKEGDEIFDSVAAIENGKLIGIQRKHHLYHKYYTSCNRFTALHSKNVCFGITICLDTIYFEPSRLLALQGATILFSPMCNCVSPNHAYAQRPPYYSHFVARAFENRCWLVTADWMWPNDGRLVCPGHSVIYDPDGQEIHRSHEFTEELLVIDIGQDRLLREKGLRVHGSPLLAQEIAKLTHQ